MFLLKEFFLNKKFLMILKWYIYILYEFFGVEKTWKNAEKTEKQNVKKKQNPEKIYFIQLGEISL